MSDPFALARQVADAVLYEGYLLYPYRATAAKNQARWQFGVLVPRGWSEAGAGEPWAARTECLLEPRPGATLRVRVRYLQVQARSVEEVDIAAGTFNPVERLPVDGDEPAGFDEAVEREVDVEVPVARLEAGGLDVPFEAPADREVEAVHDATGALVGRIERRTFPVAGLLRLGAERLPGPYGVVRLSASVENASAWSDAAAERPAALRRSLVAAHTLLAVDAGAFLSLLDPPEWARPAAAACRNEHTWPVLAGPEGRSDVVLSSPIILYDHPAVAAESPGAFFDSTEIDELLVLRTLTLTDEEKREARATDRRAAAIVDRVDTMPPEYLERLHGAVRYLRAVGAPPAPEAPDGPVPWWDPGADESVSPATDAVRVAGVDLAKGSRVRLQPGGRRADAHDLFLVGRAATVEAVFVDVDGDHHLAVTLDDDPAADLARWHGRYLYFAPDEVVPL